MRTHVVDVNSMANNVDVSPIPASGIQSSAGAGGASKAPSIGAELTFTGVATGKQDGQAPLAAGTPASTGGNMASSSLGTESSGHVGGTAADNGGASTSTSETGSVRAHAAPTPKPSLTPKPPTCPPPHREKSRPARRGSSHDPPTEPKGKAESKPMPMSKLAPGKLISKLLPRGF